MASDRFEVTFRLVQAAVARPERQSGGGQRDLDFKLENLKNFHLDFKVRLPPAPQCFFDVGASAS